MKIKEKLTFSGHDSFQCRHLWLKKGYDFIKNGGKFSNDDAVLKLGVGKNMVSSIYFWMKAFGMIDNGGNILEIANYILDNDYGKDPYLEDEATLWLLHYQLVTQDYATTYSFIFNEFRKEKIEFTKENYISFASRKAEEFNFNQFNNNTVNSDFDVFIKMYHKTDSQSKDKEDTLSGLFTDLNLIRDDKRGSKTYFSIVNEERNSIPDEILLFCIIDQTNADISIGINVLEQNKNNISSVFAIGKSAIYNRMENFTNNKSLKKFGITFSDHAGLKELQFKVKPNKYSILDLYYDK